MYSRLLSQEDLGRMIAAAPSPREEVIELGMKVFEVIAKKMHLADGQVVSMTYKEIIEALGEDISPKEVGAILREMGLGSRRGREGYYAIWNREQIDILNEALEGVQ